MNCKHKPLTNLPVYSPVCLDENVQDLMVTKTLFNLWRTCQQSLRIIVITFIANIFLEDRISRPFKMEVRGACVEDCHD